MAGKPLKDHQEVMGHARAIELIYAWLDRELTEAMLFELHKAVQTEMVIDIYKPHGAWKVEPNGTYAVSADGRQVFIEYALPEDVPVLMDEWLRELNRLSRQTLSETEAIDAHARLHTGFVHIHPFRDGNGRMARLPGNLPVLRSGHLPVVVGVRERKTYIDILAAHHIAAGQLTRETGVWPDETLDAPFQAFCRQAYRATRALIEQARAQQARRDAQRKR